MPHDGIRLNFALESVFEYSVVTAPATQWREIVYADGRPTLLEQAPGPLSSVHKTAVVVAVAASGVATPNPGIDIVRYHKKDFPYVYNVDRYTVLEDFQLHVDYERILRRFRIPDSSELQDMLQSWIFIVGPKKIDAAHWSTAIPEFIRNAKRKA
jgi:hypothetical protein